jgi:hypothetical protein
MIFLTALGRAYHCGGNVGSWPGCTWVATTLWLHRSIWSPRSSGHATRSLRDQNAFQSLGKHWAAKQTAFIAVSILVFASTRRRVFPQPSSKLSLFPHAPEVWDNSITFADVEQRTLSEATFD